MMLSEPIWPSTLIGKSNSVKWSRDNTAYASFLDAPTAGHSEIAHRTVCYWVAEAEPIGAELGQGSHLLRLAAGGEAASQGCQAGQSWSICGGGEGALPREQVAIEAAEDEPFVLEDRAANGAAAKLLIAAQGAGLRIALRIIQIGAGYRPRPSRIGSWLVGVSLRIAQSVQERIIFRSEHRAVPGIASRPW